VERDEKKTDSWDEFILFLFDFAVLGKEEGRSDAL
jgi:hypothetical protein